MTPCCRDCGAGLAWHGSVDGYYSCPTCEGRDARDRCERLAALYFEPEEAEALLEWAFDSLRTWHDVESAFEDPQSRADLLSAWQMEVG